MYVYISLKMLYSCSIFNVVKNISYDGKYSQYSIIYISPNLAVTDITG